MFTLFYIKTSSARKDSVSFTEGEPLPETQHRDTPLEKSADRFRFRFQHLKVPRQPPEVPSLEVTVIFDKAGEVNEARL